MTQPRVAIVAMGGLFSPAATPERLWEAVLARTDHSRDVPPERWLLPPQDIHDPSGPLPDRVLSRRGYSSIRSTSIQPGSTCRRVCSISSTPSFI